MITITDHSNSVTEAWYKQLSICPLGGELAGIPRHSRLKEDHNNF